MNPLITGEPLVALTRNQACQQAARLRKRFPSLAYTAIADILDAYHGVRLSKNQVAYACRSRGAPKRRMSPAKYAALDAIHASRAL